MVFQKSNVTTETNGAEIFERQPVSGPRSADGRLSRSARSAQKETQNAAYRSAKQEARVELAKELFDEGDQSLAQLRLSRGLSQAQLANAIGTSQPHIAKIEAGRGDQLFSTIIRLADALGVSLDILRPMIESAKRIEAHD